MSLGKLVAVAILTKKPSTSISGGSSPHFTGDSKITLYNKLYQQEDFNLFILRDSVPKFRILPKFQTRVLPLKKFTINI